MLSWSHAANILLSMSGISCCSHETPTGFKKAKGTYHPEISLVCTAVLYAVVERVRGEKVGNQRLRRRSYPEQKLFAGSAAGQVVDENKQRGVSRSIFVRSVGEA